MSHVTYVWITLDISGPASQVSVFKWGWGKGEGRTSLRRRDCTFLLGLYPIQQGNYGRRLNTSSRESTFTQYYDH